MDTKTILSVDAFMGWCLIAVTVISTIYATYLFLLACSIYIILLIPDNNLRFRLGKISAFIAGILGCLTMIPLGGIVYVMFFTAIPPLTVSIMIILIGIAIGAWFGMDLYYLFLVTIIENVELIKKGAQDKEKVK